MLERGHSNECVWVGIAHRRQRSSLEALDPDHLESLARYEVNFDRKLERMLTILIRPQDLRRASPANLA